MHLSVVLLPTSLTGGTVVAPSASQLSEQQQLNDVLFSFVLEQQTNCFECDQ